jgi:hypothetical protein
MQTSSAITQLPPKCAGSGTVPTAEIAELIFYETPVRRALIILETCHAGQVAIEACLAGMQIVKDRQQKSLAVLTAAHPADQIVPGDFGRLFDRAVRSLIDAGSEPSLLEIADRIRKDPDRPNWQEVTQSTLFATADDLHFFPSATQLGHWMETSNC